ncbi:hypothetical protein [Pedosphaera parvula]|uniref:PBS lyase HEAT domain protein repeat-containing protein n=1 Tax=Pedosphaera parvula (strain Ellin514) TaxID=320771 RepID=B9XCS6_PEDPL|nr:hypothetical protein [Pedosphaera parvula]EEF62272.1 hypothetical protein Cflav_PD4907 [Pedosphaera parvula Ellin514]
MILQSCLSLRIPHTALLNKNWAKGILIASLLLGVGIYFLFFFSREPSYHGRKLSAWMEDLQAEQPETKSAAKAAIRNIGTKAVPLIINYAQAQDSPLKNRLKQLAEKQTLIQFHFTPSYHPRLLAYEACDILGPAAQGAIPALSNSLNAAKSDPTAAYVLTCIGGPKVIPPLRAALNNPNRGVAQCAKIALKILESKTNPIPNSEDYQQRNCEFNRLVLTSAFEQYRATHTNQPASRWPSALTNRPPVAVPEGFQIPR